MKNKVYFSFLFLTVLLFSCKKEIVEDPILPSIWTEMKGFKLLRKTQLHSHANDNRIAFLSANSITEIDDGYEGSEEEKPTHFINLGYDAGIRAKYPITDDYLIGAVGHYLLISTFNDDKYSRHQLSIKLSDYDSLYSSTKLITKNLGFGAPVNNKNQCLIPYNRIATETSPYQGSQFFLVDFELEEFAVFPIKLNSVIQKEVPLESGGFGVSKIEAIDSYFFMLYSYKTIRLDENGEMNVVYEGAFNDIIESNDTYYALSEQGLFFSVDKGLNWTFIENIDRYFLSANYSEVQGHKIAYINDQIWKIDFSKQGMQIEELDNKGLVSNHITSIAQYDGYVFISTLSGVFTKPLDEFF